MKFAWLLTFAAATGCAPKLTGCGTFYSRLKLELADNRDDGKWIVTAPLIYKSDFANGTFMVHRGFKTDLASVPRIGWLYAILGGHADDAAVVHDFLYSTHLVDRATADAVLYEACFCSGVAHWRAWCLWAGVRIGGASHWQVSSE